MLTKIFSPLQSKKPLDRATAVGYLVMNLTTLPGLGSVAGGRRIGYCQMMLSIGGLALIIIWMFFFCLRWVVEGEFSVGDNAWIGLTGIVLNVGAWLWSLFTGLSIIRESEKQS